MNRRHFVISTFAYGGGLSIAPSIIAQTKTIESDLAELAEGKGLKTFNRSVNRLNDAAKKGVHLNESQAMVLLATANSTGGDGRGVPARD